MAPKVVPDSRMGIPATAPDPADLATPFASTDPRLAPCGGRSRFGLCEVANQLADDASQLLVLAGAQLDIGWLPVVRADPDAMYSVLQNLLTNAVKFTRPGVGPRLSISSSRVPTGWRISMTDNGIGIPAQRRADVFTPFTRANADAEGHGIGLGRVARIVYSLGGRVGADEVSAAAPTCGSSSPRSPMYDSLRQGGAGAPPSWRVSLHGLVTWPSVETWTAQPAAGGCRGLS